jgi:hypothetical protein
VHYSEYKELKKTQMKAKTAAMLRAFQDTLSIRQTPIDFDVDVFEESKEGKENGDDIVQSARQPEAALSPSFDVKAWNFEAAF